uniref:Metallophos domain-containing protein n=1 Tax=Panagrellus redivivus TaxID=6233 RepID=A0A7E4VI81_PANRE
MFENGIIRADPMSHKPVELWKRYLKQGRVVEPVKTLRLNTPIYENKVRFVCISDTHEKMGQLLDSIPDGDVLIHAGDFTEGGDIGEVIKFNAEIGTLPHKYKFVVPGNHELGFEDGEIMSDQQVAGLNMLGVRKAYEMLNNCEYIVDRTVEVYGLKIYGSPWHPMQGYSFYRSRGSALLQKWNNIPSKVDVLVTHTPPLGHGDYNAWNKMDGILAGCAELLNTVEYRVKPKFHVFGHIHDRYGATTNGATTFINASSCDHKMNIAHPPIIFDIPLPYGHSKTPVETASVGSGSTASCSPSEEDSD